MSLYNLGSITISFTEYGDPNGFPILVQHGLIASIKDGDLFEVLSKSGARIICIARPGYGESSPYAMGNIGEWGHLVKALTNDLRLTQFDVLGMSSGAPYSYAIGWVLPETARNIFIFSGIPALYDDQVLKYWPFEVKKDASLEEMKKLANELFFSNLSPYSVKSNDIMDSMAHETFGIALDFRLRGMDWGFKLGEVQQKVFMRHARFDSNVPLAAAELTAAMLNNATLDVDESDIHFSRETLQDFFEAVILPRMPNRE